ncbi:MAG: Loki-CTERM sorting domain-containing protein [Promethearchaeota archaeon]
MNDDDEVLYEYSRVSAIPGYELPILLGITAAFVIGIIYIIRKRK